MDIAIIDYGIGNLRSAEKAFQHLGFDAQLTQDPAALGRAKKLVLPGVGAFGQCMAALRARGFSEPLRQASAAGVPLLGICVGLQMFFERSAESPEAQGLGLLQGSIVRFGGPPFKGPGALKIPQIGWNGLEFAAPPHPLFAGIAAGSHVYFVHSFYPKPADDSQVLAWADYGGRFCCAAGKGNLAGVQFHPEKSQAIGLQILANFGRM
ncbi:MAG: imidazole glycerol phosphate synthase subunit HisH [Planctomycetota bacterium]